MKSNDNFTNISAGRRIERHGSERHILMVV